MLKKLLLITIVLISLPGCSRSGEEPKGRPSDGIPVTQQIPVIPQIIMVPTETIPPTTHPLMVQHTLVPNNAPLVMSTVAPEPPKQPSLLNDDLPDVAISVSSQRLNGKLDYTGPISIDSESIEIPTSDSGPIIIQYRLPEQMGPIPNIDTGTVQLLTETTPALGNIEILISDDTGLIFGQVKKSSESRIEINLGGLVSLRQSSVVEGSATNTEVEVNMVDNGSIIAQIPIGVPTSIKTSIGHLDILVEGSFYFNPDAGLADIFTPYSMTTWIVRKG